MEKARILVVDDDPYLLRTTSYLLEREGYAVIKADTGEEGLRLATEEKPDMILLDVVLPDIEGIEVCRLIKSNPDLVDTFVVFLSAMRTGSGHQAEGLISGADGYIARPIPDRELLVRVQTLLRLQQAELGLRRQTRELDQRVRELHCLYAISAFVEQSDVSLPVLFEGIIELIPPAWQHPEITGVRIIVNGQEFHTENFQESEWRQTRRLLVRGKEVGSLEVCLLENKSPEGEVVFSKEEQDLIKAIAGRLSAIIERLWAVDALRKSEERFRTIFENSPIAVVQLDLEGKILMSNPAFQIMLGYSEPELSEKSFFELIFSADAGMASDLFQELAQGGCDSYQLEKRYVDRNGQIIWVQMNVALIRDEIGNPEFVTGMAQDITDRRRAEQALSRQAEVDAALVELSAALLSSVSIEDISIRVLEIACQLTGSRFGYVGHIDPETGYLVSSTLSRDIWDVCRVMDKDVVFEKFTGLWGWVLKNREPLFSNNPFKDPRSSGVPKGHLPIRRFISAPAMIDDELVGQIALANAEQDYGNGELELVKRLSGIYALALQRHRSEETVRESEEKFRTLFNSIADTVIIYRPDGTLIEVNKAASDQLNYDREELLSMNIADLHSEDRLESVAEHLKQLQEQRHILFECTHRRRDGLIIPIEVNARTIDYQGTQAILSISRDITERKQRDQQIRASLHEKELLLREIHHRVKNNLQVISSLLELQSSTTGNIQIQEAFQESQTRIRSMARVHEQLYQSGDFACIDMAAYIQDLVGDLRQFYDSYNLAFEMRHAGVELPIDQAIPCGLLINELVSNAMKHAFPTGKKNEGRVGIAMDCLDGHVELIISDNGIGLPDDLELRESKSLGLNLIRMLTRQLRGELIIKSEENEGTTFKITFPVQERRD